jgi:NADPH-ferrihemoprotein reductase
VSVEGSGMRYLPGDSLGVLPSNDPSLVERLLQRLGQDGAAVFSVASAEEGAPGGAGPQGAGSKGSRLLPHLGWPCTLRHALLYGCDLTSIPRHAFVAFPKQLTPFLLIAPLSSTCKALVS